MKKLLALSTILLAVGLSACSSTQQSTSDNSAAVSSTTASSSAATQSATSEDSDSSTAIIVTIDGTDYPATLNSIQATQSLLTQLPLDASFRDFSSGFDEKITDLSQPLDYGNETYNNDPSPLDIGYSGHSMNALSSTTAM